MARGIPEMNDSAASQYLTRFIDTIDNLCVPTWTSFNQGTDPNDQAPLLSTLSRREREFEFGLQVTIPNYNERLSYRVLPAAFIQLVQWQPSFLLDNKACERRMQAEIARSILLKKTRGLFDELLAIYHSGRRIKLQQLLWENSRLFTPVQRIVFRYADIFIPTEPTRQPSVNAASNG
jgi:hypothetical protein